MNTACHMTWVETCEAVRAAFTDRNGGVSIGSRASLNLGGFVGDEPSAVATNRSLLCAAMGADPARAQMLVQVHGADVHRATPDNVRPSGITAIEGWPKADALVCDMPGIMLMVMAADCLPVLMWRDDGTAVGAAHAGWRGLVAGVLENTVAALGDPTATHVAIGPAIGPCCYPVSAEVRSVFTQRFGAEVVDGEAVNLSASARIALERSGIVTAHVHDYGSCTSCGADRWFSHRASGGECGRQAGVIMRVDPHDGERV